uniref:Uncharacterized protein n=1 Tax=Meloidogyne floridensis TaxID=298350 RepID=A0A915P0H2_9BILA
LIKKMFSELIEINKENNKIIKIEEEINKNVEDWSLDLDIKRREFELKNDGFAGLLSSEKTKIVWGIINLGYPPQNVAYKINYYTQIIIKEKMEIELNEWVKGENFVEMYQHYLLVICAYSPDSLGGPSLCDLIESHLTFLLIKKFETLKFIEYFHINPKALFKRENCPKETGIKEEGWKCIGWIIGFKILKEEEIKENMEELKNKIKSLKENDLKKYIDKNGDGKIKIGVSYLNKKNVEKFIIFI